MSQKECIPVDKRLPIFGVIAASGIRVLVESKVDYNKASNLMLTAIVMGIGVSTASISIFC